MTHDVQPSPVIAAPRQVSQPTYPSEPGAGIQSEIMRNCFELKWLAIPTRIIINTG